MWRSHDPLEEIRRRREREEKERRIADEVARRVLEELRNQQWQNQQNKPDQANRPDQNSVDYDSAVLGDSVWYAFLMIMATVFVAGIMQMLGLLKGCQ